MAKETTLGGVTISQPEKRRITLELSPEDAGAMLESFEFDEEPPYMVKIFVGMLSAIRDERPYGGN